MTSDKHIAKGRLRMRNPGIYWRPVLAVGSALLCPVQWDRWPPFLLVSADLASARSVFAGRAARHQRGVYLCHRTAKDMGVHDHGSIVWDEFIGMWITLMAIPVNSWQWVVAGLVLFRVLDIWKPWPIRWFDRNVHGGMGIMVDDIIAGIIAAAILYGAGVYLAG